MFIDEYFNSGYYKELPIEERSPVKFGRICWTHAYYPHEDLQFFRPVLDPDEPTRTMAVRYQIEAAGKDAFRRSLPLGKPKLETNEEFIVVRALRKRRDSPQCLFAETRTPHGQGPIMLRPFLYLERHIRFET